MVAPLRLDKLAKEMSELIRVSIGKDIEVRYAIDEDVSPVEADATQMRQVVMNLVLNAADATNSDGGTIDVSIDEEDCDRKFLDSVAISEGLPEGRYVRLVVRDRGCGIKGQDLQKIFDPFYSTKESGHGLGLAAVLGIVKGHHGAITVDSELQQGTTVSVLLPASNRSETYVQPKSDDCPQRVVGQTILVVDDEPLVRTLVTDALRRFGYSVLTACDGREALEVYARDRERISAVLLDLTMPVMGGEETFEELLKLNPDLKIILTSGFDETEATSRFLGRKTAGFVKKAVLDQNALSAHPGSARGEFIGLRKTSLRRRGSTSTNFFNPGRFFRSAR